MRRGLLALAGALLLSGCGAELFKATIEFRNVGFAPIALETSSNFSVYLSMEGDAAPIGTAEGARMGTGLSFDLIPGGSKQVEAFGGSASCTPDLGYVLPLGRYDARALIDFSPPEGGVHLFWSDPRTIEVVAP